MPFNVDNFNSEIAQTGIASPSHFEARILAAPRAIAPMMRGGMAFRIEAVNIPGRTLTTLDQNYHGVPRKIPYMFTHQPVTFTVIMSRDMREREAFMKWQDFFIGHSRTSYRALPESPFDSHYYNDAIGTVEIIQYSYPIPQAGKSAGTGGQYVEMYNIKLEEAYPSSVNDIQMSWGDEGYAKLQVEMTYRYATEAQKTFFSTTQSQQQQNNRMFEWMKSLPPGAWE